MTLIEVDELTVCPICFECYDLIQGDRQPRILPCQKHSICTECTINMMSDKLDNKLRCPFDNDEREVGLKSIPKNRFVMMHLERTKNTKNGSEESCEKSVPLLQDTNNPQPRLCTLKRDSSEKPSLFGFTLCYHMNIKSHFTQITENLSAYSAGIRVGDRILEINEVSVKDLEYNKISDLIEEYEDEVSFLLVYDKRAFLED